MVKKISALVLALVLCLSVVVVPANAAKVEIGDNIFAIAFEWDKTSYNAGDTAYLSVYADGHDDYSFYTGTITFGLSSDVFDPAVHTTAYLKENTTTADWFNTYYKAAADGAISQLASTVATNVTAANTAEEQALYDWYVKIGFAKNSAGSHENVGTTKAGFGGADFNPDEPIMVIALTVKEDVADGTAVSAAITSGTFLKPSTTAPSTGIKYYKTPGEATTTANVASSSIDITKADTTETMGDVVIGGAEEATLAMTTWKQQIKFGVDKDGAYNDTFSARTFVEFTNFSEVFDDAADALNTDDGDGLLEVGFVYKVGDFDEATAKGYVEAGVVAKDGPKEMTDDGYTVDRRAYVSTTAKAGGYVMGSTIADIPAADKTTEVTVLAYAKYTTGGEPVYVYHPVSGTFETLYNTYYSQAFPG